VGQKAPNACGLFDIYGNLSEWCQDWFGVYTAEDKVNPLGPATGKDRVYRGGSWGDPAANSRCAERGGLAPASRVSSIGFRVVMAPILP
jgi:formylglycine-generating enzyme required for sulfatase activity